jgi:hypothetical protein
MLKTGATIGVPLDLFTYVVDCDEKLRNWVENNDGYDYTSVWIAEGTWEYKVTQPGGSPNIPVFAINFKTTGTKRIVGAPGSALQFTFTDATYAAGIGQDLTSLVAGCSITGVTLECHNESSSSNERYCYGFFNCANLSYCTSNIFGAATAPDGTAKGEGYGFYKCNDLTNCVGNGTGEGTNTGTGSGTGIGTGFDNCDKLTNCVGTGNGKGSGVSTEADTGTGYGFNSCKTLTNCVGTGTGTGISSGHDNGNGYGFKDCTTLINCAGLGTARGTVKIGYGFANCKRMTLNKPGTTASTLDIYDDDCKVGNTSGTPADTAEGGWNIRNYNQGE